MREVLVVMVLAVGAWAQQTASQEGALSDNTHFDCRTARDGDNVLRICQWVDPHTFRAGRVSAIWHAHELQHLTCEWLNEDQPLQDDPTAKACIRRLNSFPKHQRFEK